MPAPNQKSNTPNEQSKHVAIVGATGAVGVEMLRCLEQRGFPRRQTHPARQRPQRREEDEVSAARMCVIKELTADSFDGRGHRALQRGRRHLAEFAPHAVKAGAVVVDNSSAFRMDDDVPARGAGDQRRRRRRTHKGIIANPNCTTAITLMALYPLHQAFGVKRIFASSYQAVSGTGAQAIEELAQQAREVGRSERAWDDAQARPPAAGLSAPDRLQRAAARRFLPRHRLHQGGDEDGKRRPQDHASPELPRQRDLRARARLPRAQRGGQRRI